MTGSFFLGNAKRLRDRFRPRRRKPIFDETRCLGPSRCVGPGGSAFIRGRTPRYLYKEISGTEILVQRNIWRSTGVEERKAGSDVHKNGEHAEAVEHVEDEVLEGPPRELNHDVPRTADECPYALAVRYLAHDIYLEKGGQNLGARRRQTPRRRHRF